MGSEPFFDSLKMDLSTFKYVPIGAQDIAAVLQNGKEFLALNSLLYIYILKH